MKEINVAVIGSGSTYCPELVDGFIKARDSLKLKKISFKNDIMTKCLRQECKCRIFIKTNSY